MFIYRLQTNLGSSSQKGNNDISKGNIIICLRKVTEIKIVQFLKKSFFKKNNLINMLIFADIQF